MTANVTSTPETIETRVDRLEARLVNIERKAKDLDYLIAENAAARHAMGSAVHAYAKAVDDIARIVAALAVIKRRLEDLERPIGGVM